MLCGHDFAICWFTTTVPLRCTHSGATFGWVEHVVMVFHMERNFRVGRSPQMKRSGVGYCLPYKYPAVAFIRLRRPPAAESKRLCKVRGSGVSR